MKLCLTVPVFNHSKTNKSISHIPFRVGVFESGRRSSHFLRASFLSGWPDRVFFGPKFDARLDLSDRAPNPLIFLKLKTKFKFKLFLLKQLINSLPQNVAQTIIQLAPYQAINSNNNNANT